MRHSLFLILFILLGCSQETIKETASPQPQLFNFQHQLNLPGTPDEIYDVTTGDISGWWDHTFSKNPIKLYIEPKPGGGFYEIFNESGDGVLHATVTGAHRGHFLRLEGPLGLAGKAVTLVCTYEFNSVGTDSTSVKISVHGAGEFNDGLPTIVEKVWYHFLFEQLKPWVDSGKHLKNK